MATDAPASASRPTSSSASRSSSCSRRSTAATASTSATTRPLAEAAALAAHPRRGAQRRLGAPGARPPRPGVMERLLLDLSINVTSMFRDPTFYAAFREKVVPILRTYPFVRIWDAGCSTGEEVYSLAILLEEEGSTTASRIYATDINEARARAGARGRLPARADAGVHAELHPRRRQARRSRSTTSPPTTARSSSARSSRTSSSRSTTSSSDRSFNEFHVIVCRNVMIYFDRPLQDRVHGSSTTASPRSACSRSATRSRSASRARGLLRGARRAREALPEGRDDATELDRWSGASWGGLRAVGRARSPSLPDAVDGPRSCWRSTARRTSTRRARAAAAARARAARCVEVGRQGRDRAAAASTSRRPTTTCSSSAAGSRSRSTSACSYARPSIDVLFESAADAYGERAIGDRAHRGERDGAAGSRAIKERGGVAIVQDPSRRSARRCRRRRSRPTAADAVLPLEEIGSVPATASCSVPARRRRDDVQRPGAAILLVDDRPREPARARGDPRAARPRARPRAARATRR